MHKYFRHYAEDEIHLLESLPECRYANSLCIPFYDEKLSILNSLEIAAKASFKKHQLKTLLILVINRPAESAISSSNEQAINELMLYKIRWQEQHCALLDFSQEIDILLVDRSTNIMIPVKQGVGLARKIACDCAAWLINQSIIESSIIYSSDADVLFPANYFTYLEYYRQINTRRSSAYVFSFSHPL